MINILVIPLKGAIVEYEVKVRYILVMSNMYRTLFFMTFYNLGLDKLALGITDSDIFQIQMIEIKPNQK
ncbi:hypothetical protein CBR59_28475 [Bacillus thuringiensis]|uniref:hypothetical protein n=1 Tax=Bacillus thuringiensis TaxID=1428 RepID=UPI000C9DE336|nr:hypothetical protein [Bacillus thuringiensis]PNK24776.1 hypothetical protein CBP87_25380 [Bacillus thuringiensis]PNK47918.1 hypothetical protein CBR59_28475 [Bacillus thuringiensis]